MSEPKTRRPAGRGRRRPVEALGGLARGRAGAPSWPTTATITCRAASQVHPLDVLVGDHVGGGAVGDRAAVVEHGHDVGERGDQSQVVLDDEDRAARRPPARAARPRAARARAAVIPTAGSSSASTGAPVATARATCEQPQLAGVVSSAAGVCARLGQPDAAPAAARRARRGAVRVQREQDLAVRRQRRKAGVALERARHGDASRSAPQRGRLAAAVAGRSARGSRRRALEVEPAQDRAAAERDVQVAGGEHAAPSAGSGGPSAGCHVDRRRIALREHAAQRDRGQQQHGGEPAPARVRGARRSPRRRAAGGARRRAPPRAAAAPAAGRRRRARRRRAAPRSRRPRPRPPRPRAPAAAARRRATARAATSPARGRRAAPPRRARSGRRAAAR